jgi:hypothetical protein
MSSRYRFAVSFVECFLRNGLESPHMLFNEYIRQHANCLPGDPGLTGEPNLHISVSLTGFEWDRLEHGRIAIDSTFPPFHAVQIWSP